MSKTVDERVVSMQFDNKQFEANVSTTMSSIDKLKQKLNFTGAAKGFDNIGAAAKNVNMSGLSSAVEQVHAKFSALEVMGVTALANITNSAVNAGKRIVSALTIDPVKTGLREYETKMNAVQVIKANTRGVYGSDEAQMKAITSALDELNDYADKTIYNFTQMTNNVGKFVAQGLSVERATKAVQGMANLAGASGASAEDMARATYQMSQALGGTIRKIDWNSLRNANMATVELKNTLMDLARVEGIDIDALIAKKGTFEDTLEEGWLTGDLFTEAMNIYSDVYSEAELKARGFTDKQIANFKDLAKTAQEATVEVKTMSQLWDVLKETAQSGWTQTWELIFGDFDEAKKLFTGLQVTFSNFINSTSEWRNNILGGALNFASPWEKITEKLDSAGLNKIKEVAENVGEVTDKLEYFQEVVNKVWRGDYNNRGDNPDRYDLLEKAGYDHRVVQDLVNLGYGYEITIEDIEASHKKFGLTMDKTSNSTKSAADSIGKLTDKELENAGLTKEEINLYRALEKEADKMGITIGELAEKMSKKDGRSLLIDTFSNLGSVITGVGKAAKEAFVEIFDPPGVGELAVKLYGILDSLQSFTETLRLTDKESGKLTERGENIKRTLKGVFALIDMVTTILAGPFKIVFKIISKVLKAFDLDIFAVTAEIGDAIVKFWEITDVTEYFAKAIEWVIPKVKNVISAIKDWFKSLKNSENLPKDIADGIMKGLGKAFEFVKNIILSIKDSLINGFDGAPGDMISGFVNGIWEGIQTACKVVAELGTAIVDKFKEILGIHSPSWITWEDAKNFILGFVNGISDCATTALDAIIEFGSKCVSTFKGLDLGGIFAGVISVGALTAIIKVANAINSFSVPFEEFGNAIKRTSKKISKAIGAFTGVMKSLSLNIKAKALKEIAIAVAILAASIAVLSFLEPRRVISSAVALGVLIGALAGVLFALGKTGEDGVTKIAKFTALMLSLAGVMLIMAIVIKIIAGMEWSEMGKAGVGILALSGIIVGLIYVAKTVGGGKKLDALGETMVKIAGAMLIMAIVAKIIAGMEWSEMGKAGAGILALGLIISGLIFVTKSVGGGKKIDAVGKTIISIAGAMLLLTIVAKIIAGMEWSEMGKAGAGILALGLIISGLIFVVKSVGGGKKIDAVGKTILAVAGAILLLTIVAKIIAGMEWSEMGKAGVGILALGLIISGLIYVVGKTGNEKELKGVASTLIAASVAIGIMAGVAVLLGFISLPNLAKGIIAVGLLAGMIAGLLYVTKNARDCKGTLIGIAAAVGVMALAVVAFSFIDPRKLAGATIALGSLIAVLALLVFAAGKMGNVTGPLIAITVVIATMAYAIYMLSDIPAETAIGSAIALGVLMLAMSGVVAILSEIGNKASKAMNGVGILTALAVPMLLFIGELYLLSFMPTKNLIKSVLALIGLVTAMTAVVAVLSEIGNKASKAMNGVIVLTALAVPLLLFIGELYLLSFIPTNTLVKSILALIGLVAAMTAVVAVLSLVGNKATSAIVGVGILTALAVPLLLFIGIIALMSDVENAISKILALSGMLLVFTGVLAILTLIGMAGPAAIIGVGSLVALIVAFAGLAVAIGALMTEFPALQEFLNKGVVVLEQLAEALGSIIGKFVGGFLTGVAESLPEIGLLLSQFMLNATPFIVGVRMVDDDTLSKVGSLAAAILLLTAADLIAGVVSFVQGGSSFAELGTELSAFMVNALPFIVGAALIKTEMVEGVRMLAETILILTAAQVLDGIASFITGGSDIEDFASKLPTLAEGLKGFADKLGTFDDASLKTVQFASDAIKSLASAAKEMPKTGGLWQMIVGENGLSAFSDELPDLGTHLKEFMTNLGSFDDGTLATVDIACKAITSLAAASKEVEKTGGLWQKLAGENGLSKFSGDLPGLGTNINGFITNLGAFEEGSLSTVTVACSAVKQLSDLSKTIPDGGNFIQKIFGTSEADKFTESMAALGTGVNSFLTNVGSFGPDVSVSAKNAAELVGSLVDLAGVNSEKVAGKLDNLGVALVSFSEDIKSFSTAMTGLDMGVVESNVDKMIQLITTITSDMVGIDNFDQGLLNLENFLYCILAMENQIDSVCLSNINTALSEFSTTTISDFLGCFTDDTNVETIKQAAIDLLNAFANGAKDETALTTVKTNFSAVATAACGELSTETITSGFTQAGKDLVSGFADGITAKKQDAVDAASAIGYACLDAIKEAIDSNSPSKEAYKLGSFTGEGFVNALDDYASHSYDAGYNMADSARNGLRRAVDGIKRIIGTDMDSQPTIQPVLDLSEVRAGADDISRMLNLQSSIGVVPNIKAISTMMNRRSQNGANDDVVDAIGELRKDIGNVGNTTSYNINGINYSADSDVANAIETLVRAIRVEGRV